MANTPFRGCPGAKHRRLGYQKREISVLVGARGTGKTTLLSYFADKAEADGWVTARVTCVAGMLDDILVRTRRGAKHFVDTQPSRKIKSIGLEGLAEEHDL